MVRRSRTHLSTGAQHVSLFQSLETVAFVNDLLVRDAFRPDFLRQFDIKDPIRIPRSHPGAEDRDYFIPFIEMSAELQARFDYESKLDRSPENIGLLMADGEKQARVFLKERARVSAKGNRDGL